MLCVLGGWQGSGTHVGRTRWDFPFGTPRELERLRAELGIAAVFHPEGLGLAGAAPPVTGVLAASWAVRPESSSRVPTVQPAGLTQTRAPIRGKRSFHNRPALPGCSEVPFALPRRAGFALTSC